ncbi:MAG: S1 RNA-binding domain-containing protein [Fimbriimonadaceae bacterium]
MTTDESLTPTDQETGPGPQEEAAQASEPIEAAEPPSNDQSLPPEQPEAEAEEPRTPAPEDEVPAAAAVAEDEPPSPFPRQDPRLPEPEPVAAVEVRSEAESRQDDRGLFEAAMNAMEAGEDPGFEGSYKKLSRGDMVEATVIQVDRDRVFVDLGTKSEGIVPLGELSDLNLESALGHVQIGDKINVVVLRPEGGEGNPIVSKKRADFESSWDVIEQSFEQGKFINAQVIDRVKGGLVVDIGVRGFVPATHVGSGKLRNIEKYVGQPMQLKIIEIDRDKKKVVLSNRQAAEDQRAKAKEDIFTNVAPGDIVDGSIRRLTEYGAFVDLGGVDGLLHISEMSWARISHPKEMFREGQKIKVMVLRLDPAAGKISLGHRQVLPDPWNLIKEQYTVGQKITCTIGRIVLSGAFIKLPEGAEAFMPASEMSVRRIRRPQDAVEEGQEVEAQIIDLRPDERRMVLSMRALGGGSEPQRAGAGPGQAAPSYDDDRGLGDKRGKKVKKKGRGGRHEEEEFEEVVGRRGFATGGATIGERLGMLKGFLGRDEEEEELERPDEAASEEAKAEPAPEPKSDDGDSPEEK